MVSKGLPQSESLLVELLVGWGGAILADSLSVSTLFGPGVLVPVLLESA